MTATLLDRHQLSAALVVTVGGVSVTLDRLGPVSIRHGRSGADGQPDAATCTFTTDSELVPEVGQAVTVDLGADAIAAFGTAAGATPRFRGTITDAKVRPGPGTQTHRRRVVVTAVGRKAKLGRDFVGDAPWPAELDGARVGRILALATASGLTLGTIDSGTVTVLARDVDRQPALGLLDTVANDAEGILLERRDGSLVYHDQDHRTATATTLELSSSEVLWPLEWQQGLGGLVNDLTVGYGSATPQAEVRVTDPVSIAAHGLYAAKVATKLADATAAEAYAQMTVARRALPWWEVSALVVELVRSIDDGPHAHAAALLALQVADLIKLTGLPTDGPLQLGRLWVEGWTETITGGRWTLALAISPFGRTGPAARWADVDTETSWAELDAAMSWRAAASWDTGSEPDGRWLGTPANMTWADGPATWATWPY